MYTPEERKLIAQDVIRQTGNIADFIVADEQKMKLYLGPQLKYYQEMEPAEKRYLAYRTQQAEDLPPVRISMQAAELIGKIIEETLGTPSATLSV